MVDKTLGINQNRTK